MTVILKGTSMGVAVRSARFYLTSHGLFMFSLLVPRTLEMLLARTTGRSNNLRCTFSSYYISLPRALHPFLHSLESS